MSEENAKIPHTLVIAHRGASALASHENTLESFDKAIEVGSDMVEFDVRRTADNELIVFHDPVIKGKPVGDLTLEEINRLAAEDGYQVPKAMDVLDLCHGKIRLDVELKETGFEDRITAMLKESYGYDDYSIKSFVDQVPARVKEIDPKIRTGLLIGRENGDLATRITEYYPERRLKKCHADFISPHYYFITIEFMERMKREGYPVYVWTVNDKDRMGRMMVRGVEGIITDRPDLGVRVRDHVERRMRERQEEKGQKFSR